MCGDDTAGSGGNDDVHGDRKGKSARCAVFATWLLEIFGKTTLSRGTGVIDVAGGRGELSFELAVKRDVPTTLLDPRHPGKLSKAQRSFIEERAVAAGAKVSSVNSTSNGREETGESPILPQRVRAMLTLHGATRVDTGSTHSGDGKDVGPLAADKVAVAAAAAAAMSAPATANDDHRKAKKRRPDAVKSAGVGWSELPCDVCLDYVLSKCEYLSYAQECARISHYHLMTLMTCCFRSRI